MNENFFQDAWQLVRPYFRSGEKWSAIGLLAVVVAMNVGLVYVNVLLNNWNRDFFDAIQQYDEAAFFRLLVTFGWLALIYIVVAVYRIWLRQFLQIRWRRWLTEYFIRNYLSGQVYYRLQLGEVPTDNPDQRIADDIGMFVANGLALSLGLLSSVITLVSFIAILWTLSGPLTVPIGDSQIVIPGYMVWVALLYAGIGTWATFKLGRPLIALNFNQQRYEADFRYSLIRVREQSEGIALYHGEDVEGGGLRDRFARVVANFRGIMTWMKYLTFLNAGYGQIAGIFPLIVMAPRYFAKEIPLGVLTQATGAFARVQEALSFFVDAYTDFAEWRAVIRRLSTFQRAVEAVRANDGHLANLDIVRGNNAVGLDQVTVALPDGKPMMGPLSLSIEAGRSLLITGRSGIGKSTLIRVLAGIWPYAAGRLATPDDSSTLFLPQRPYLPQGDLRTVLAYPARAGDFSDAAFRKVLELSRLESFVTRLDERANWSQSLSPGEQQRIAFARAFLHKPRWLFLDEATSALDEATERGLYEAAKRELPETTLVSVGHRAGLAEFHDRRINLETMLPTMG